MKIEHRLQQTATSPLSLLWPEGEPAARAPQAAGWVADLGLESLVRGFGDEQLRSVLLRLTADPRVIGYRQEVLEDILRSPRLQAGLRELLPSFSSLVRPRYPEEAGDLLHEVIWRLGELESYRDCVHSLGRLLDEQTAGVVSRGLRRLHGAMAEVRRDPVFANLERELPELLKRVRGVASLTVGINLNRDLQPAEATLLSVNSRRFEGAPGTFLGQLFGGRTQEQGIAALHRVPAAGVPGSDGEPWRGRPMLVPLFRDLSDVLTRVCRPVARALQRYLSLNGGLLAGISRELAFYLGAAGLIHSLRELGLPTCRPEIVSDPRVCRLLGAYNPNLAFRLAERTQTDRDPEGDSTPRGGPPGGDGTGSKDAPAGMHGQLVLNDVSFGPEAGVLLLTGPNRGGKTTYMQAVGLAQLLAQAGLHVPARQAVLSPVDAIYTHFPDVEHPEMEAGRLGEEAQRLRAIFEEATPRSLVLLNESLATTSPQESLQLARDVVRALRHLGARTIYTTHLHELAAEVDRLNSEAPGPAAVLSLVSLVEEGPQGVRHTFRIVPGPPAGESHADEIARRYGISYPQLVETLRRRGVAE